MKVTFRFQNHNRKHDLDNCAKALLDAFTKARIWLDDSQITDLRLIRGPDSNPPQTEILLSEIN